MNLAEFSIKNTILSVIVILLTIIGGWTAYKNMPRFEDSLSLSSPLLLRLLRLPPTPPGQRHILFSALLILLLRHPSLTPY